MPFSIIKTYRLINSLYSSNKYSIKTACKNLHFLKSGRQVNFGVGNLGKWVLGEGLNFMKKIVLLIT